MYLSIIHQRRLHRLRLRIYWSREIYWCCALQWRIIFIYISFLEWRGSFTICFNGAVGSTVNWAFWLRGICWNSDFEELCWVRNIYDEDILFYPCCYQLIKKGILQRGIVGGISRAVSWFWGALSWMELAIVMVGRSSSWLPNGAVATRFVAIANNKNIILDWLDDTRHLDSRKRFKYRDQRFKDRSITWDSNTNRCFKSISTFTSTYRSNLSPNMIRMNKSINIRIPRAPYYWLPNVNSVLGSANSISNLKKIKDRLRHC